LGSLFGPPCISDFHFLAHPVYPIEPNRPAQSALVSRHIVAVSRHFRATLLIFGPRNGSTLATKVLLLVVVVLVVSTKAFFISQPIVIKLRIQIEDNILHNRTVSDFQVKSKLILIIIFKLPIHSSSGGSSSGRSVTASHDTWRI